MSESPNDFRNIVAFKDDYAVRTALGRAADALEQAAADNERLTEDLLRVGSAHFEARIEQLEAALSILKKEASGCLHLSGVREAIGNTNFGCLELRINEASQLLAGDAPPPTGAPPGQPDEWGDGPQERHGLGTYSDGMVKLGYRSGSSGDDPEAVPDTDT